MSKNRKKRFKPYRGEDAAVNNRTSTEPTVHRYVAVPKNPLQEWWQSRKKAIILGSKIGGVTIIVVWLIYEAAKLVF